MTVEKGASFWVQSTIIPPPWPPPFNDLLRADQKGARGRVSVGACAYVPVCVRRCTHTYTYTRICTYTRGGGYHLLPDLSETFSKTLTKTLDKMTYLWYDTSVIRYGDNLDDHSCTSCVLEDGDLAIGVPVFLSSKSSPQTLDIQDDLWYNILARVNGDTLV